MATYILFWNPAFSSYTMERFKDDFENNGQVGNWSFHEHEKVKYGDKFYMVRCGEGNVGIVMQGIIESPCYEDEDWSPKNRKPIFYADIWCNVAIDSDTAPKLLTPDILTEAIPDFNWYGGHSGRLLNQKDANILNKMWVNYLNENSHMFPEYARIVYMSGLNNLINDNKISSMLAKRAGKGCECCGYDYKKFFNENDVKKFKLRVPFRTLSEPGLPKLFYRFCNTCWDIPREVLIKKILGQ